MAKRILGSKAFLAFISGFLLYFLTVLPDVIQNGGILMYYGDYRLQVIPFTYHLHDRMFDWGWDHTTGLGGDFLTQYAFYNLFSPFTLIYALIPRGALLWSMPFVTALKYAVGTMLGYFYLKRFTKDPDYAVIGGVIYAFSAFNAYNMIFHFIDAVVFFPLLLTALEELCGSGRRGVFALTVAFLALINYYFFFGEVIFTVIYFFVRFADKSSGFSLKALPRTAAESVIGVCMAMFMLLPMLYVVLTSEKATGTLALSDMFYYGDLFKYLRIAQSLFMIPDTAGFASISLRHGSRLRGSLSAPILSCGSYLVFLRAQKYMGEDTAFDMSDIRLCACPEPAFFRAQFLLLRKVVLYAAADNDARFGKGS